jgi:branched-subunit amino acid aminotransferase/4-amino-4-deoxychorismate lyase
MFLLYSSCLILSSCFCTSVPYYEGRLDPALLYEAEEMFFSCSPLKVFPIRQIEDRVLSEVPGPVTQKLVALIDTMSRERTPDSKIGYTRWIKVRASPW